MKRNSRHQSVSARPSNHVAADRRVAGRQGAGKLEAVRKTVPESARSGLLGLCHEIAGLILRRHAEGKDAVTVRREVSANLVRVMACPTERAERLIDLSLELIHLKVHGRYQRDALELSLLIAQAANQLRKVGDN